MKQGTLRHTYRHQSINGVIARRTYWWVLGCAVVFCFCCVFCLFWLVLLCGFYYSLPAMITPRIGGVDQIYCCHCWGEIFFRRLDQLINCSDSLVHIAFVSTTYSVPVGLIILLQVHPCNAHTLKCLDPEK